MGRFDSLTQLTHPPVLTSVSVVPDPVPVPVPPTTGFKRRFIRRRHPLDIYEDQFEALKVLSEAEKQRGLPGSMSAMVREAIDSWLQSKKLTS